MMRDKMVEGMMEIMAPHEVEHTYIDKPSTRNAVVITLEDDGAVVDIECKDYGKAPELHAMAAAALHAIAPGRIK